MDPALVAPQRPRAQSFRPMHAKAIKSEISPARLAEWSDSASALLQSVIWLAPGKPLNKARLWHERLNHAPYAQLRKWRNSGAIIGLDFTDAELKAASGSICSGCAAGRTTRRRRPVRQMSPPATRAFQRIHADLGFMPVADRYGRKIILYLIDGLGY